VRKTSVYLPDHLKRALGARARATRRSEAEVVRAAVEAEVAGAGAPGVAAGAGPGLEQPVPGRLVGVGVGPGDPDLLTLRAVTALRRADRVVAPSTATDAVGRAETIVRQAAPDVQVERAPFAMHPDPAVRAEAMQAIAATVAGHLDAGDEVAFITLGDPLTYSTFSSLADAVLERRPRTTVEVVPGIMAFQSLAARTRTTLVDERQRLSVRTAVGDGDVLGDLAADLDDPTCTVVVYKGGRHLPRLAEMARTTGRAGGAVAGELLGMSGERVGDLSALATGPAGYLATVILPAREGAVPPATMDTAGDGKAAATARAPAPAPGSTPPVPAVLPVPPASPRPDSTSAGTVAPATAEGGATGPPAANPEPPPPVASPPPAPSAPHVGSAPAHGGDAGGPGRADATPPGAAVAGAEPSA
jgi:precorrin-2/cobalt-factor-2 C20-methyltransferase